MQLNITLIRPVILYGAKTWPLRKLDERKLVILERKILRKVFRPVGYCIDKNGEGGKNTELATRRRIPHHSLIPVPSLAKGGGAKSMAIPH